MRSKEKNKKGGKKIVILAVIAILIIGIAMLITNLGKEKVPEKTNLVINNNNVTSRLKQEVYIDEEGIIYISKQDIANFFDKYIYEDEEYNKIITTSDKKLAEIGYDSSIIKINGSQKDIGATIIQKDDTIYLPISELKDVYDIETEYAEETNTVIISSLDRELIKVYANKNLKIKTSTKFLSKTVEKLKKGDTMVFVSKVDDTGYAKVRTNDGKIGYVKEKYLTNYTTVRSNMEEEKQVEGKINLVWDYYSQYVSAPDRTGETVDGVNVVSPSFFYLDKNGELQENIGSEGKEYIEWAKENNYKVWAMVSNAGTNMINVTSEIMNDYYKREELIEQIIDEVVKYNLDGINLDFENMKMEDKDLYSRFVIELSPRLKEIGKVLSVDVTAPDGGETWSLCFDRHVIGTIADYIVFMAYDQYGVSSIKAGTTAGYNWVETSLKKFLETEEIESGKIILAVPFYTRLWTENGESVTSKVVNMKDVDSVLPDGVEKTWDDTLKQNYVEYTENGTIKKMWIEDLDSLKAKLSLIKEYNLAGVGSWEKDRESDGVWQLIKEELGI